VVSGIAEGKPVLEGLFDQACNMLDSSYNPVPVNEVIGKVDAAVKKYI
jgi:hypothetical protein